MSITVEQYKKLLRNNINAASQTSIKKKNKFNAQPTIIDNIRFDSKLEAKYYQMLVIRLKAGDIKYFLRQVPIRLHGKTCYWADFMVVDNDNSIHWIDCKGRETNMFRLKKRQVEELYPIIIELVKK